MSDEKDQNPEKENPTPPPEPRPSQEKSLNSEDSEPKFFNKE